MENVCYAQSSRKAALAWTTIAFFAGFAGVAAFGPIIPKLKQSMVLSPLLMGLLGACPALTGSLLRIPFGAMVDRSGGKKPILVLLGLSAVGIAGTTVLFALFPTPVHQHYVLFLISGILCGCGIAVFSVGIPTVSYWYPQKKQGTALAIYAGLGNLAPGIFSLIIPILVMRLSLAFSYALWLVPLLALMTLFMFFMKDAPYFQYKEMGIEIDPDALLHACGEEILPSGNAMTSLKRAGASYRTWILTIFYFVSFGGFIALTTWFPTYWEESFGLSLVEAGALTAAYSLSASLIRILGGTASDRFGGEKVIAASFSVIAVGSIIMIFSFNSIYLAITAELVLALGMGVANGAVFKLVPKFMPEAVGGTAGIVGGLGAFGGFVIPVIMGSLVDWTGHRGYSLGFVVFLILSLVSLALFNAINRPSSKIGETH